MVLINLLRRKNMIPKIIHYIWLGGKPLPKVAKECIESWEKYCPDYEIKRWDESNLNLDINKYCRQAYDCGKYAFASDVLRYDILYNEGGIYLDIDVKLIKNIDVFLSNHLFMCMEDSNYVAPGLIVGAEKGNRHLSKMSEIYNGLDFIKDNKENLTTICELTTNYFTSIGLIKKDICQSFDDVTIYDSSYFNPFDRNTGKILKKENTYSIHLYFASWKTRQQKLKIKFKRFLNIISFGMFDKLRKRIKK